MNERLKTRSLRPLLVAAITLLALAGLAATAGTEPLTFQDLMKFRQIEDASIAKDGRFIAYALRQDRGEGEAVARAVDGDAEYRVERGGHPVLSGDSRWMACAILPGQKERDEAATQKKGGGGKPDKDDGPRNGLALVSLASGDEVGFDEVESFAISEDGRWLARKHHKPKDEKKSEKDAEKDPAKKGKSRGAKESKAEAAAGTKKTDEKKKKEDEDRPVGTKLVLRDLAGNGKERTLEHVSAYSFDEPSTHLVYAVATPDGKGNGLFAMPLRSIDSRPRKLSAVAAGRYTHLTWAEESSRLAFVAAVDDDLHDPGPADVWWWDGASNGRPKRLAASDDAPEGWRVPSKNPLTWSKDGERLFFGYQWIDPVVEKRRQQKKTEQREKKREEAEKAERAEKGEDDGDSVESEAEPFDPYDIEAMLDDRELDVWHTDDPYIIPNQKIRWKKTEKDRVHLAVAHVKSGKVVRLADRDLPDVRTADNGRGVIATSNLDYRRRVTWDGNYVDVYHVGLDDGRRTLVAQELRSPTLSLSPDGRYVLYWATDHWHLFDAEDGETLNLTAGLDVPFADEDDDYPAPDPGYGVADWIEGDRAVLIYDKFDIWRFPTDGGRPVNVTGGAGRAEQRKYRLVDLDPKIDFRRDDESLLLRGYHDVHKNDGYWRTRADRPAVEKIVEEQKRFRFRAKAEEADRILYTRESYDEFPDLWVADVSLGDARKLSAANPDMGRFARGTAELVDWISADGVPLQGILIKPGNYQPGRRYPVLVYYYRFFSQRLHQFNQPVVNHRPSFPVYASQGYAVFLPDIRFEIGRPGMSAVKALVPGVQKLIEMGIADPDAIGLHGHSWSGYQTAHVITQTNMFAAAVAGAPVSNMTSAYSGIRLGSGLARQFQYEQSQSRIGGSLDAELPKYLENSPVFHARHIETPLLIQFGDKDEAVPWQQGIELYLAMRRLDKDVIFLQYRGEPHHLKKYANKLDYSMKMMEYFDHHLKGTPAPEWISEGVPYRGE